MQALFPILHLVPQQGDVPGVGDLSNLLQKGGLAAIAAIFIIVATVLYNSKEKKADAHAAELKSLHSEHAKAFQDLAEKNRVSDEAKNEKMVGFVVKLTEVVSANTVALEHLTENVDKLDRRS